MAEPAATAPPPAVRARPPRGYGYGVMSSARFAQRFWATIDQPLLAIETPRSMTPPDERKERIAWFGGTTTLVELDTGTPPPSSTRFKPGSPPHDRCYRGAHEHRRRPAEELWHLYRHRQ